MKYQLAQYSLCGARAINQDRAGAAERPQSLLMVVADGLGGHSGGEVAAETFVATVLRIFNSIRHPLITDPSAFLALTVLQAHKAVVAQGKLQTPPLEPRTTCVLCLVQEGYAYWAHVGDSRLYHFRGNQVRTRTQDHTALEQLRRDGLISEEEMSTHPHKSHLSQSIGGASNPKISLGEETLLHPEDVLLLCTDGLWEALSPREIGQFLQVPALDEAVEEMMHTAEQKMGNTCDNLSAVCLRWEDRVSQRSPLPEVAATQVDQNALWDRAAQKAAAVKAKQTPPRPATGDPRHESIERRIQEIEEFIRKFEPKS